MHFYCISRDKGDLHILLLRHLEGPQQAPLLKSSNSHTVTYVILPTAGYQGISNLFITYLV